MTLPSGSRLGPYEISALLGVGGMGEVYRARDPRLGRDVALKLLPAGLASDAERLRRFQQEARAAAALNHPNLLAVFDLGTHEGAPYIVAELLDGQTLAERLASGPLALRKAIDFAVQLAQGLAAAHQREIVHRDLKPENLFLTREGRLKILDFGLAKLQPLLSASELETLADGDAAVTSAGVILGTVGYMSPEQVRGLAVDHRADLFSFGVILYEMLTSQRAFRKGTAVETMTAILHEEPPEMAASGREIPAAVESIVRHCLEKNPDHRFQSAHDIAFALEALSGSAPLTAAKPRPVEEHLVRHRGRALLAAGLLLAALASVAFFLGRRAATASIPSFQRLTFRRGCVWSARFAPDGHTVVYSAAWDGDPLLRLFSTRVESPESTQLDLPPADLLGISRSGELGLIVQRPFSPHAPPGTLVRAQLGGGAPRPVLDGVVDAGWIADGSGLAVARFVGTRTRLEFPLGTPRFEDEAIFHLRVSPQGDRVAFFHAREGALTSLAVVDREGKLTEIAGGWKWASSLAWAPSGEELWFTATTGGALVHELYVATLSGRKRLLMRLPIWNSIQDIAPDGRALMTLGLGRFTTACLPPGGTQARDVSWFEASFAEDLSPDGTMLLFDERGATGGAEGTIYAVDTTEAGPPVRLGDGTSAALSPDKRWAATRNFISPREITLLPIGAGEARTLPTHGVLPRYVWWFPDSKAFFFQGREPDRPWRTYSLGPEGGRPRPLTPEGVVCWVPSPDGSELLCSNEADGKFLLYSLPRQESRPAPGLQPGEQILYWAPDGAYVRAFDSLEVERVDLSTGKRALWRRIVVPDPAGLFNGAPASVFVAPLAGAYCYSGGWGLSDLYLVTGLE